MSSFLKKANMRRRRITTEDKDLPSAATVNEYMMRGQAVFISKNYDLMYVWNMDETAYTYAIGPTHMFVPPDQSRAAGSSNAKARITAVIIVNGVGDFAPLMIIIKHSEDCTMLRDESVWAAPQVAAEPEVAFVGAAVGGAACDVGGALLAELISALEVVFEETVEGADNNDFETDLVSYEV
jgi:hypothetical protein